MLGVIPISVCVGCGLAVNGAGVLEVQRRPCGGIECDNSGDADDGLFLSASTVDTATIDIGGTGTCAAPIFANVKRSAADCNGIVLNADGIYAHCPDSIVGSVGVGHTGATLPIVLNATHDIVSLCTATATSDCVPGGGTDQVRVCNTLCCGVGGIVSIQAFGGEITDESTNFAAVVSFDVSVNGGAYGTAPVTSYNIYNDGAINRTHFLPFVPDINFHTLAPAECVSFSGRVRIQVTSGTAVWANVPRFEFHWQFTQTGCC